jgi:hypothetical protein
MSERRMDSSGRDVTDLPGLWSDEDKVIPAKPEAISMMDYSGIIAVTAMPETVTIEQEFSGEESDYVVIESQYVRQLADWLTRYADWREAQDAAK